MKILFRNALILTMNEKEIIKDGFLAVEGSKITSVSDKCPEGEFDRVIDCKNKLIMPGLINCHTHIPMILMRGYGGGLPLDKWLNEKIFPIEDKMKEDDFYWSSLLALAESAACGVTSLNDMYFSTSYIAKAVDKSKMRAMLYCCGTYFDDETSDFEYFKKTVDTRNLIEEYKNNDRISFGVSPHAIYTCTDNYLKFCGEEAKRLNTVLHIHLSETQKEFDDCMAKNGVTPTKHLENLGVLSPKTIAAHGVYLTDDDIEILKKYSVTIVNNPTSNLKLGSGICDTSKLIKSNVNVALGTDGASSNNNLNMFEELHIASLICCGEKREANLLDTFEYLKMATVNGAKALGFEKCGVIKAGNAADIIMLDLDKPHLYPIHDVFSLLVYSAQGSDVCMTISGGEIIYENGEYKTIDIERTKFEVERICNKLFK